MLKSGGNYYRILPVIETSDEINLNQKVITFI